MNDENKYANRIITIPNILSLFRLLLIPLLVWSYFGLNNIKLSTAIYILSGVTDLADGFIARRFHMISNLGKILDPVADKFTQAAVLFCLTQKFPIIFWLFILLVIKEIIMGIIGAIAVKICRIVQGADIHGKIAASLIYITAIIHILWTDISCNLSLIMIICCAIMMCSSMVLYIKKYIYEIRKSRVQRDF